MAFYSNLGWFFFFLRWIPPQKEDHGGDANGAPSSREGVETAERRVTHSVFMLRMARRDMMASVTAFLNCLEGDEEAVG